MPTTKTKTEQIADEVAQHMRSLGYQVQRIYEMGEGDDDDIQVWCGDDETRWAEDDHPRMGRIIIGAPNGVFGIDGPADRVLAAVKKLAPPTGPANEFPEDGLMQDESFEIW